MNYSEVKPTFGPKRTLRSQVWEEVTSGFEGIAQQIWLFSGRFLPQERADVKLGRAKLENRWRYNEASRVLDLANKGLEMDDLDCLSESEIKPLEIPNRAYKSTAVVPPTIGSSASRAKCDKFHSNKSRHSNSPSTTGKSQV